MSDVELKPCPFCGSTPNNIKSPFGWIVSCSCKFMNDSAETEKGAADLWNTRLYKSPNVSQAIEEIDELIRRCETLFMSSSLDYSLKYIKSLLEGKGGEGE